jgi:UPF0755 protein
VSNAGRRRAARLKPRKNLRLFAIIAVVLVLVAGGWFGYSWLAGGAPDYSGKGTGSVEVTIASGAGGAEIGETLYKAGVVKSAAAFYKTALADDRSSSIQPGVYTLRKQMSSKSALAALLSDSTRVESKVTVTEGARINDVKAAIVKNTKITAADLDAALQSPTALGLPAAAGGNPEGYFYPATYTVEPGETATELLTQMVQKSQKELTKLDIAGQAPNVGLTEEQVITMASILEYEGKNSADYPKIARVLYNRLAQNMPLQLDSTIAYANDVQGDIWTTSEQRSVDSPYNTYLNQGLPPGPIGSPGETTLHASVNPADGDWLYFFAKKDGSVVFSATYAEHTAACKAEYGQGACGG